MSKKIPEHLKGFEEVIQEFGIDSIKTKSTSVSNKSNSAHESQRFLEIELERLTLLDNFLSKKILIMKNFSQTEELIIQQENKINERSEELVKKINTDYQRAHQNISILMDAHFKKN